MALNSILSQMCGPRIIHTMIAFYSFPLKDYDYILTIREKTQSFLEEDEKAREMVQNMANLTVAKDAANSFGQGCLESGLFARDIIVVR